MPGKKGGFQRIWHRLSARQVLGLAVLIGAGVTLEVVFIGYIFLFELSSPGKMVLVTALLTGVMSAVLAFTLMSRSRERHLRLLQWLRMMREMNHHTRNALEQINYSAYSTGDQEAIATIGAGVGRIDWALREILTQHGTVLDEADEIADESERGTSKPWGPRLHFAE